MEKRIQQALAYESTKMAWRKNSKSVEFKHCSDLNLDLFGERLKALDKCECVEIFFFNLHRKIKNNQIIKIMDKKFVVKGMIMNHNLADALTEDSSDEAVIAFLAKLENPEKHLRLFKRFDENWKELVSKSEKKSKESDKVKAVVVEAKTEEAVTDAQIDDKTTSDESKAVEVEEVEETEKVKAVSKK